MSRAKRRQTTRTPERRRRKRLGGRQLTALVEETIVDAYGDSEQLVDFLTMLEENLDCPFTTTTLGKSVAIGPCDDLRPPSDAYPRQPATTDCYGN